MKDIAVTDKETWFSKYVSDLEKLAHLPPNWDSYGAEPPNSMALYWGRVALDVLQSMNFSPDRVSPSADRGVGISFIRGDKYADIECFNTGEILAVTSNRREVPDVWEVSPSPEEIRKSLEKIRVYLQP